MSTPIRSTGPINAPMPGLLDLFNLKTFGANPTDVSQNVWHCSDIQKFLIGGKREIFQGAPTPSTSGGATLIAMSIPNNEAWLIDAIGLLVGMGGTVLSGLFSAGFLTVPGTAAMPILPIFSAGVGANAFSGKDMQSMLFGPGSQFVVYQASTTGAAFTAAPVPTLSVTGVRLRA